MEMGYAIALKDHRDGKLGDLEYCQYHADNVITAALTRGG